MPVDRKALDAWFQDEIDTYAKTYVLSDTPWRQSGFSGPEERWVACRKPIADCMEASGAFLDVGCANGYLLESVLKWTEEKGVDITPYGLDIYDGLIDLAKRRLPAYQDNLFIGNVLDWQPPFRFDYVRTELIYVPEECQRPLLQRLLADFLSQCGKLLVCEYCSRHREYSEPWVDEHLGVLGFRVLRTESGFWEGKELTRVAALDR